jgi:hypothetical protein
MDKNELEGICLMICCPGRTRAGSMLFPEQAPATAP